MRPQKLDPDWGELVDYLADFADRQMSIWYWRADVGRCPGDYANQAITDYWAAEHQLVRQIRTEPELRRWAKDRVRQLLFNDVTSLENMLGSDPPGGSQATRVAQATERPKVVNIHATTKTPEHEAITAEEKRHTIGMVRDHFAGKTTAMSIIEAMVNLEAFKPKDIAAATGLTVEVVYKVKRDIMDYLREVQTAQMRKSSTPGEAS